MCNAAACACQHCVGMSKRKLPDSLPSAATFVPLADVAATQAVAAPVSTPAAAVAVPIKVLASSANVVDSEESQVLKAAKLAEQQSSPKRVPHGSPADAFQLSSPKPGVASPESMVRMFSTCYLYSNANVRLSTNGVIQ